MPSTFAGILIGERRGRRLLFRRTVERGLGLCTAKELLRRAREPSTSPFQDLRLSRRVTWLEPTLSVEVTFSELMQGRLRDPVYRGIVYPTDRWVRQWPPSCSRMHTEQRAESDAR